ncbi:MAG: hypothetical protein R3F34_02910 [Planctomycetota bacterium]
MKDVHSREGGTNDAPEAGAELDMLELGDASSSDGVLAETDRRAWRRLKAGLLVEQGVADKKVAARVQEAVRSGSFDPDRAADEILAAVSAARAGDADAAALRRSSDLARDLVMAPHMRGVRRAARRTREAARRGVAYLLVQLLVVLVFAILFALGLLAARYAGYDIHEPLDRALGWVGLAPR